MTKTQINNISYEQALNVLRNNGVIPFNIPPNEVLQKAKELLTQNQKKNNEPVNTSNRRKSK